MKSLRRLLLFFMSIIFLFSCSVSKRRYMGGYFVARHKGIHAIIMRTPSPKVELAYHKALKDINQPVKVPTIGTARETYHYNKSLRIDEHKPEKLIRADFFARSGLLHHFTFQENRDLFGRSVRENEMAKSNADDSGYKSLGILLVILGLVALIYFLFIIVIEVVLGNPITELLIIALLFLLLVILGFFLIFR